MSNEKHYPLHPNATHPPIMTCEIPLEEYESIKRENAELKDKCQMHDFFWEGCGFAKRGFKNAIAVSEDYDFLESENAQLKESIAVYQRNEKADIREIRHHKYKRCMAMADKCVDLCHKAKDLYRWAEDENLEHYYNHKIEFFARWHERWLKLAEKFKPNYSTAQ